MKTRLPAAHKCVPVACCCKQQSSLGPSVSLHLLEQSAGHGHGSATIAAVPVAHLLQALDRLGAHTLLVEGAGLQQQAGEKGVGDRARLGVTELGKTSVGLFDHTVPVVGLHKRDEFANARPVVVHVEHVGLVHILAVVVISAGEHVGPQVVQRGIALHPAGVAAVQRLDLPADAELVFEGSQDLVVVVRHQRSSRTFDSSDVHGSHHLLGSTTCLRRVQRTHLLRMRSTQVVALTAPDQADVVPDQADGQELLGRDIELVVHAAQEAAEVFHCLRQIDVRIAARCTDLLFDADQLERSVASEAELHARVGVALRDLVRILHEQIVEARGSLVQEVRLLCAHGEKLLTEIFCGLRGIKLRRRHDYPLVFLLRHTRIQPFLK